MGIARIISDLTDALYIRPVSLIVTRELFRYALCGAMNMTLDALWYFIAYHFIIAKRFVDLGFVVVSPHIASLAIVFPVTFFIGFWLNRHVAFRTTAYPSRRQLARYALTVAGALAINYVCMKLLVESLGLWATPSKMITTLVSAAYSFLAAKFYTFRRQ